MGSFNSNFRKFDRLQYRREFKSIIINILVHTKEDKAMKKANEKKILAGVISSVATAMLTSAANSRCAFVYHQPKQPTELKKFRKF